MFSKKRTDPNYDQTSTPSEKSKDTLDSKPESKEGPAQKKRKDEKLVASSVHKALSPKPNFDSNFVEKKLEEAQSKEIRAPHFDEEEDDNSDASSSSGSGPSESNNGRAR